MKPTTEATHASYPDRRKIARPDSSIFGDTLSPLFQTQNEISGADVVRAVGQPRLQTQSGGARAGRTHPAQEDRGTPLTAPGHTGTGAGRATPHRGARRATGEGRHADRGGPDRCAQTLRGGHAASGTGAGWEHWRTGQRLLGVRGAGLPTAASPGRAADARALVGGGAGL